MSKCRTVDCIQIMGAPESWWCVKLMAKLLEIFYSGGPKWNKIEPMRTWGMYVTAGINMNWCNLQCLTLQKACIVMSLNIIETIKLLN